MRFQKDKKSLIRYACFAIVLLIGIILFRKLTTFFLLTLVTSVIVFYIYHMKFPFDLSPVLIFSFVLTRTHGIWFSIAFLILAGIVPMLIAGGTFDFGTLVYTILFIIPNIVLSFLPNSNFMLTATILMLCEHISGSLFAVFNGVPAPKEIVNFIAESAVDWFYIFLFSGFLISVLS